MCNVTGAPNLRSKPLDYELIRRSARVEFMGKHNLNQRKGLLQITEIGRDGCNLRLREAVRNWFHNR
jgi:hypothetical protein